MSAITKTQLKSAQRILNNSVDSIPDKGVNQQLATLVNIGTVKGKSIKLTLDDRLKLEKYFDNHLGQSVRNISLDEADRLLAAKQSNNEKLATGNVFDALINIARHDKPLPIQDQFAIYTPPGLVMSVPLAQIDVAAITHIVVIENGQLLTHWHTLVPHLPAKYRDALIVYKGHGNNQNRVRELLKQTNTDCHIAFFFDFDPAGIKMALEMTQERADNTCTDILLPANLAELATQPSDKLEKLQTLSKTDTFNAQHAQLQWLEKNVQTSQEENDQKSLSAVVQLMKQHKLAVTQEHLVVHEVELGMSSH